ncbi:MAG: DUF1573 domain-containing protein [Ferruginibacter sp.]
MKKTLLLLAVSAFSLVGFAQKKISDVAKFESETIDFGKIKQSVPQKGTFKVTNIGTEPLIIEQANPTCGCTISDYTKEPIAPGKTGYINATYNAAALGHFDKHLTVKFAGVDEMKSISFTGDVLTADEFDKNGKPEIAAKPEVKTTPAAAVTTPAAPVKATKKVKKTKKTATAAASSK